MVPRVSQRKMEIYQVNVDLTSTLRLIKNTDYELTFSNYLLVSKNS